MLAELDHAGDRGGGGRLDPNPLPFAQKLLGGDDLLIGDVGGQASGVVDGFERLLTAGGVTDADGGGQGLGVVLGDEVPLSLPEGHGDGVGTSGLYPDEPRHPLDPSRLNPLGQSLVNRPDVRSVAHGEHYRIWHLEPELLEYLEGYGLLPLGAEWVDGVEEVEVAFPRQLADHIQGVVEVAIDGDYLGPVEHGLCELAQRHLPGGEEHYAT